MLAATARFGEAHRDHPTRQSSQALIRGPGRAPMTAGMTAFVYILACSDRGRYTGSTTDLRPADAYLSGLEHGRLALSGLWFSCGTFPQGCGPAGLALGYTIAAFQAAPSGTARA